MARTSKTRIKGVTAGESANRARQGQTADSARATAQAEQRGARAESQIERGLHSTAGSVQSQIARGEERDFRREQAQAGRDQQQAQFEEQTDLRAAQAGLERNPEFGEREQRLQEEIARGGNQERMPGELDGQRFVQTEQRRSTETQGADREAYRLRTDRMRVEAQRQRTLSTARTAARKGDEEGYKAARADYSSRVKKLGERAEKIIRANSGDPRASVGQDDISYIKQLAADNPNPELQREIESGQLGPASARFLRGRMIYDSLDFVAERGDWPDQDLIDEAHPLYQEFNAEVMRASDLLRQRQQVAGVAGVQTLSDANRMKRKIAAIVMKQKALRQRAFAQQGQMQQQAPGPGGQQNEQSGNRVDQVERPSVDLDLPPPPATLGGG